MADKPFTYLIGWKKHDRWYYGVRYARNCHPDDLWTSYFTSSKEVKRFREKHGEPDVIEVRQTFNDSLQAREWEHKVLRRLRVIQKDKWMNKSYGKSVDPLIISQTQRNLIQNEKHAFLRKNFSKDVQRKRIENGTHHFIGGVIQKERVRNGTHHLLGEKNHCHKKIKNGTHHFIGGVIQKERVRNGTHNFLGGEIQKRMVSDGTHPFLIKIECNYCKRVIDKGNFSKYHRRKM